MQKNQFIVALAFIVALSFQPGQAHMAGGSIRINENSGATTSREVRLSIVPPQGAVDMRIANEKAPTQTQWEPIRLQRNWTLDYGTGSKSVYVEFRGTNRISMGTVHDTIALRAPANIGVSASINNNEARTNSRRVHILTNATDGIEVMAVVNDTASFQGVRWQPFQKDLDWIVSPGSGLKKIYIRYRDVNGKQYNLEKSITYEKPLDYIEEGSLLKGETDTVYYLGYGGQIHPFLHSSIFLSYRTDFRDIRHISNARLREHFIGEAVCLRPGAWLIKFKSLPKVYAPEPGCDLRPIRSEAEAYLLYGPHWASRIVELDPIFSSSYEVHEVSEYPRYEDRDRDGVDKETEERYGTSDTEEDTDHDSVSDFEEIFYWISNPTNTDTDGDGYMDGTEIMNGRSPVGSGTIEELRAGTYTYPFGTMVYRWWDDKKYYYYHQDEYVYFMGNRSTDAVFTTNRLQERFIISPPIPFAFEPREGWYIEEDHVFIKEPLTKRNGAITPL